MLQVLSKALIVVMLVVPSAAQRGGRGGGGGGGGGGSTASLDPTPFEQFVSKLKLNEKEQLPAVQRIFTTAAAEGAAISKEMVRLRVEMLALDAKPADREPVVAAYAAQAARMTALEVKAFQQVYALLENKQKSKSGEAFVPMAGLFHPPVPSPSRTSGRSSGGSSFSGATRLALLVSTFKLDDDHKKLVKKMMDDAYKAAKPVREQVKDAREALGDAIQKGQGSLGDDAPAAAYAQAAAAMTGTEMKALAEILTAIQADTTADSGAVQTAASIMLGAFVGKKWDVSPNMTLY